jgi:hypothetical protein
VACRSAGAGSARNATDRDSWFCNWTGHRSVLCQQKLMVPDTLKPDIWNRGKFAPLGRRVARGFANTPCRVIISKPVTRGGIRRAADRNGFWDNENRSHGRLLGNHPPSPSDLDRSCRRSSSPTMNLQIHIHCGQRRATKACRSVRRLISLLSHEAGSVVHLPL